MENEEIKQNKGKEKITKYMWIVLICCLLGWSLDGMDGNLFSLVIQPAMAELLPPDTDPQLIGMYGGLNVALYLFGWATGGIIFGMLADIFGRVRVLAVSIILFSLFTGLTGLATEWWHIGVCRFLTGLGSGAELPIGTAMIAEVWGESKHRTKAAAFMTSGFAIGFFLASLVYRIVGGFGWRIVFFVGILPALVVFFIIRHLEDPEEFKEVQQKKKRLRAEGTRDLDAQRYLENPLKAIWRAPYRKNTIIAIVMCSSALIGFWCVSAWLPQVFREFLTAQGVAEDRFVALVSYGSMVYNIGGFFGYVAWGFVTEYLGRKGTFSINLVGAAIITPLTLQFANSWGLLLVGCFFIGYTVMGFFAGTAVYIPELYPTRMRSTAMAFTNCCARYLTAIGPFIAGLLVLRTGTYANAISIMMAVYIFGIIALIFARETRDKGVEAENLE